MRDENKKVLDYDHSTTEPERESIAGGFILGWFMGTVVSGLAMVFLLGGAGLIILVLVAVTLIAGVPIFAIVNSCSRTNAIDDGIACVIAIIGAPMIAFGLLMILFWSYQGP